MTVRPRAIRALRDVRERLRDAAAANHAKALHTSERSRATLEDEQNELEAQLDHAAVTLAAARTVHDLGKVADALATNRVAIADATTQLAAATAATEASAGQLRERTRQLRSAEKLVELSNTSRTRAEAKTEQRHQDDLAARRR